MSSKRGRKLCQDDSPGPSRNTAGCIKQNLYNFFLFNKGQFFYPSGQLYFVSTFLEEEGVPTMLSQRESIWRDILKVKAIEVQRGKDLKLPHLFFLLSHGSHLASDY